MSTATPTATALVPEQRVVVHELDWNRYRKIADAMGDAHVRLTYNEGSLEFMTLSHGHERCSNLIGRFIEALTEELDLPIQSGGSTTLNREDLDRAAEPDQCFYIDNEPLVRGKDEIDLAIDPPPDLVVEVDITRSSRARMKIYSAMRIPEVWRYDGAVLRVLQLEDAGEYLEVAESRFFPGISPLKVSEFLSQRTQMDANRLVRGFRQWVREALLSRQRP